MKDFYITKQGSLIFNMPASQVFFFWEHQLLRSLKPFYRDILFFPSLIQQELFDKTDYARLFPQHVYKAKPLLNSSKHSQSFLAPAVCHQLFQLYKQQTISRPILCLTKGRCFRYEDHNWNPPFRLSEFTMYELIGIGAEDYIETLSKKIIKHTSSFLKSFFPIIVQNATDSFYMGEREGARLIQKMKELKKEFIIEIDKQPIALGSFNMHEDHFTKLFSISDHTGHYASSFCLAFGIERLTVATLMHKSLLDEILSQ